MKALISLMSFFLLNQIQAFQFHNIQRIKNTVAVDLDYNIYNDHDFNGDKTKDRVICNPNHYLQIKDGKTNKLIFSWYGPQRFVKDNATWSRRRVFSGCEVVQMPGGKPIVLISNYWDTLKNNQPYWRARSAQFVAFHNGSKYVIKTLKYDNDKVYFGVSRSVKCHAYPWKLVSKGYNKGVLCFYADYAADSYNRTALFKLEQSNDKRAIIAKDVTNTLVGSPWRNGPNGTSIYSMPLGRGWASNQRDGAFMMDSDFLNFQGDGLIDLITIGQHAKVRAHRMIYDPSYSEGFRYSTSELTDAAKGVSPTEFIKVRSTKRFSANLNTPCAYFSSEAGRIERDHFRCFHNNRWVKYDLPIKFNSVYRNATMALHPTLGIIIKTGFRNADNVMVDLKFKIPFGNPVVPAPVIPTCPYRTKWNGTSCVYDFNYPGR